MYFSLTNVGTSELFYSGRSSSAGLFGFFIKLSFRPRASRARDNTGPLPRTACATANNRLEDDTLEALLLDRMIRVFAPYQ